MQRLVEILDASSRVLASVPFLGNDVPRLDDLRGRLPLPFRGEVHFRFENGLVDEGQWQAAARDNDNQVLRLRLRRPPPRPPPLLPQAQGALPGELFAVSGPRGDTIYSDRAAFERRMRDMVREDGWDQLKLIFPVECAAEFLNFFQEENVQVLQTQGAIKLRKDWHERATYVGAGAAAFGWAWGRKKVFAAAAKADVGFWSKAGAGFVAEGLVVGAGMACVLWWVLPRMFMQKYTVIMKKSLGTDRLEMIRVEGGVAARELLLGQEVEELLEQLVGQGELKEQIHSFARLQYAARKGAPGAARQTNHMVLKGSPGTGKTTVARILGKVLQRVGITTSDRVVEVQRGDLVGEYVGHTAQKTRARVREARGGVLFVDEAYRLLGSDRDFGREALEEIMQDMESGDPVVVFAGYPRDMDALLRVNAGFPSRVPHHFEMQDYGPTELAKIFLLKVRGEGLQLEGDVTDEDVANLFRRMNHAWLRKHNGRAAVRLLTKSQEEQARRLFAPQQQPPGAGAAQRTLVWDDLERGIKVVLHAAAAETV